MPGHTLRSYTRWDPDQATREVGLAGQQLADCGGTVAAGKRNLNNCGNRVVILQSADFHHAGNVQKDDDLIEMLLRKSNRLPLSIGQHQVVIRGIAVTGNIVSQVVCAFIARTPKRNDRRVVIELEGIDRVVKHTVGGCNIGFPVELNFAVRCNQIHELSLANLSIQCLHAGVD